MAWHTCRSVAISKGWLLSAEDHDGDVVRVYKFSTKSVVMSRDVKWTGKIYNATKGPTETSNSKDLDGEDEDADEEEVQGGEGGSNDNVGGDDDVNQHEQDNNNIPTPPCYNL